MEPPSWKAEVQYLGGFGSPVWQGIFLPGAVFSADSLTASVQPPFTLACLNICVHIKNPKLALSAIPLFGWTNILHPLIGMGSCSCGCCALPRKGNPNFLQVAMVNEVLKKKRKKFGPFWSDTISLGDGREVTASSSRNCRVVCTGQAMQGACTCTLPHCLVASSCMSLSSWPSGQGLAWWSWGPVVTGSDSNPGSCSSCQNVSLWTCTVLLFVVWELCWWCGSSLTQTPPSFLIPPVTPPPPPRPPSSCNHVRWNSISSL